MISVTKPGGKPGVSTFNFDDISCLTSSVIFNFGRFSLRRNLVASCRRCDTQQQLANKCIGPTCVS